MIGAFWICVFTIAVGILLYIGELRWRRRHGSSGESQAADAPAADSAQDGAGAEDRGEDAGTAGSAGGDASQSGEADGGSGGDSGECCGLHLVCEKDSLSPTSDEIIYYDDEELDRFIGRDPNSYTPEETDEFRDVLMTLLPEDVPGWARSVTQRRLELPPDVRDELLMLVNDLRSRRR